MPDGRRLVLASTSPYRRALLQRVFADFRCERPEVDEAALPGESATQQVARLARAKAANVAARCPGTLVIGSDQLAQCESEVLGKPGSADAARAQLAFLSGRSVRFLTAVAVLDADSGRAFETIVPTEVVFHALAPAQIAAYVEREQPYDCAGSFKSEALGIALFQRIVSDDPTALIGLPLIALCRALREFGVEPLLLP